MSDRTVGRTNASLPSSAPGGGGGGGPPSSTGAGESIPSATTTATTTTTTTTDGGGVPAQQQHTQQQQQPQWPTNADRYELMNRIGQGAFASVWRARRRRPRATIESAGEEIEVEVAAAAEPSCAVKIMDLEHVNINICDIRLEVQTMRLSSHPNVLVCYTSFIRDTHLWLVTQLMEKGSALHCLQSARAALLSGGGRGRGGCGGCGASEVTEAILEGGFASLSNRIPRIESLLFENHITYILFETLLGLRYIHDNGQIHRDVKAGNILLDGRGDVRIADFGVSSWLIDGGSRRENTRTFVGTPCWMAPEVMEQVDGYDYKADIWSLGITALELAKGYAPYAKHAPMKVLLMTIQEDPPTLETYADGDDTSMWSKSFRSMVRLCLQRDLSRRPTCSELLAHRHFRCLSTENGRSTWRRRIREELCDAVEDVGLGGGTRSAALPGNSPVQIVATTEKGRPAGTSWIFSDGSQVMATASGAGGLSSSKHDEDFFDEFERQTAGENFYRDEANLTARDAEDDDAAASAAEAAAEMARAEEDGGLEKKDEEDDDMDDFFDEFEKVTGGENFRREC